MTNPTVSDPARLRAAAALVALATLALAACHDSDDDGGASGPLVSLGVSAVSIVGGNGLWVLEVSEADEGATDLNGDGDALDRVAFLYRGGDGSLRNLELALSQNGLVPTLVTVGDVLVGLVVSESAQGGTDLNGDGDAVDDVMHVYDDNTGVVTNTERATGLLTPVVGAGHVAFVVSEAAQGGTDLDGSGAAGGFVLHVFDSRTGLPRNAERNVTSEIVFHDHAFAFTTDELSSGADLNADGDATDQHVFEMYDIVLGGVEQVPLAVRGRPLAVNADDWFLLADETEQGEDLNGDLDQQDGVMHEVHPHQGTRAALPFSALGQTQGRTSGSLVAFFAQEIDGFDRNGDGDLDDSIVVIYDRATAQTHTGLAGSPLGPLAFSGTHLGFLADEADEGLDLNLDGDELDTILQVLDGTDGSLLNTELDAGSLVAGGGLLVFRRTESESGTDHNGDGDTSDWVLFHIDPLTGALGNTGIASGGQAFAVTAAWILLISPESSEGDLNGDGDLHDVLYVAHERASGTNTVLGLVGAQQSGGLDENGRGVLLVAEDGTDLNGDGDGDDSVPHALTLP